MPNPVGARKNGNFKAVSTAPSINKTPVGSSTPPLPYPVTQDLSSSSGTIPNVRFNHDPAYVLNQSTQPACIGDATGSCGGVKSGTVGGEVKPVQGSGTVRINGHPIVREGDPCTLNNGNCLGIYVTAPAPSGEIKNGLPTGNTDPLVLAQTPEERAWLAAQRTNTDSVLFGPFGTTCTPADPTGQGNFAQQRLTDLSQQYADHASGKVPLPPDRSLWLRGEINRVSQLVKPGQQNMWPDYSPAEKQYMVKRAEQRERDANSLGIALLGPVFGGPAATARVLGAPESVVGDLEKIGLDLAGAVALKGAGGRGRVNEPLSMREVATTPMKPAQRGSSSSGVLIRQPATIRIGRWMSKAEYEALKSTEKVQPGAGGATYGATSGPESFMKQAKPGSVYVEYDVSANSVLKGSKSDWVMTIGPEANT